MCNDSFMSQQGLNYHMDNNVCRKPNRVCPRCLKYFTTKRSCLHHVEHNICQKIKKNYKPQIIKGMEILPKTETPKKLIVLKSETNKHKNKKTVIPPLIRQQVWFKYIGKMTNSLCYCCGINEITSFNFEIGHIVAEKYGGSMSIENLRPICHSCNISMSCKNMIEYAQFFYKNNNPSLLKEFTLLQSDMLYEI